VIDYLVVTKKINANNNSYTTITNVKCEKEVCQMHIQNKVLNKSQNK